MDEASSLSICMYTYVLPVSNATTVFPQAPWDAKSKAEKERSDREMEEYKKAKQAALAEATSSEEEDEEEAAPAAGSSDEE